MDDCLQNGSKPNNLMPLVWNELKGFVSDPAATQRLPVNQGGDKIQTIDRDGFLIIRLGDCSGSNYISSVINYPCAEKLTTHLYAISEDQLSADNFEILVFVKTDQPDAGTGVIVRFKKDYHPSSFDIYLLSNSSPQIELYEWTPGKLLTDEQACELVMGILSTHAFEANCSDEMVINIANTITDEIHTIQTGYK